VAEFRALGRIGIETRGRPADGAGELYRFRDPEAMGGCRMCEHARVGVMDGAWRRA
jgi:hypothetical protein